jgi:hypothetical protein
MGIRGGMEGSSLNIEASLLIPFSSPYLLIPESFPATAYRRAAHGNAALSVSLCLCGSILPGRHMFMGNIIISS